MCEKFEKEGCKAWFTPKFYQLGQGSTRKKEVIWTSFFSLLPSRKPFRHWSKRE